MTEATGHLRNKLGSEKLGMATDMPRNRSYITMVLSKMEGRIHEKSQVRRIDDIILNFSLLSAHHNASNMLSEEWCLKKHKSSH